MAEVVGTEEYSDFIRQTMSIDLNDKYILSINKDGSMNVWMPKAAKYIQFDSIDYLKTIKEICDLTLEYLNKKGVEDGEV